MEKVHEVVESLVAEGWDALLAGRGTVALATLRRAVDAASINDRLQGQVLCRTALAHDYLGQMSLALEAFEQALPLLRRSDSLSDLISCLYGMGHCALQCGDVPRARTLVSEAVALADLSRVAPAERAHALINLGNVERADGKTEAASAAYEEARECFERVSDRKGMVAALNSVGSMRQVAGDFEGARELYLQALELAKSDGLWMACNDAHMALGRVAYDLGDLKAAADWFDRARDEACRHGHLLRHAEAAYNQALMYDKTHELEPAMAAYREALAVVASLQQTEQEARILRDLIRVCRHTEAPARVLEFRRRALHLARDIGGTTWVLELLDEFATIYARIGYLSRALDYWESALALGRRLGQREREGMILDNMRRIFESRGRPELALSLAEELVHFHRERNTQPMLGRALVSVGQLLLRLGAFEEAGERLQAAAQLAEECDDGRLKGMVEGSLASLTLARGDTAGALSLFEQAMSTLQSQHDPIGQAVTLSNMAIALDAMGDVVRAHTCRRDAERLRMLPTAADPKTRIERAAPHEDPPVSA